MNLDPECYGAGYFSGRRLREFPRALDDVLGAADTVNGDRRFHPDVRRRANAYVIGFSDGWHELPPLHPPVDPMRG